MMDDPDTALQRPMVDVDVGTPAGSAANMVMHSSFLGSSNRGRDIRVPPGASDASSPFDAALLYTPLKDCLPELRRRVAEIGGHEALDRSDALKATLAEADSAILYRQMLTPNFEFFRYLSLAEQAGLRPVVTQYGDDKFVSRNPSKQALLRLGFYHGMGRGNGARVQHFFVGDSNRADGQRLRDVCTWWGQPLMEFHEELFQAAVPALRQCSRADLSPWFLAQGGTVSLVYCGYMNLAVRHAVIFETFHLIGEEGRFTADVVVPAFQSAWQRQSLKPLIAALDPPGMELAPYWEWYPPELQPLVEEKLRACGRLPPRIQYSHGPRPSWKVDGDVPLAFRVE